MYYTQATTQYFKIHWIVFNAKIHVIKILCVFISNCFVVQEQDNLQVNVEEKLNTEMEWLNNVNLQEEENCEEMQMLLAGHLKLVAALFTCGGIDKEKYGQFLKYWCN